MNKLDFSNNKINLKKKPDKVLYVLFTTQIISLNPKVNVCVFLCVCVCV